MWKHCALFLCFECNGEVEGCLDLGCTEEEVVKAFCGSAAFFGIADFDKERGAVDLLGGPGVEESGVGDA